MMLDYLTDPRDYAICGLTPTLVAPHFSALPPVPINHYRFVMASNGLFLQARNRALNVTLRMGDVPARLPYGPMQESVELIDGPLPYPLFETMRELALGAAPREWAGIVVFDPDAGRYRLVEPAVTSASAAHITYDTRAFDDEFVVLDIHSHGYGQAFFSRTDDESDQSGIKLATVLGHCREPDTVAAVTRIAVHGHFYPVNWTPWESAA